jgi:hypothetical protein
MPVPTTFELPLEVSAEEPLEFGSRRVIDGVERIYHYGYWVKTYPVPANSLSAKKALIEALTRRLFNHTEHGLNVPGVRLAEARAEYLMETDARRRRVKGAMLAGALFNRATDIFTHLVELQACGVDIQTDNALMRECGACLKESLQLGRLVLHRSGEEGIDELWGEPFRAFSIPIEEFFASRYIKIAQAMRDIDRIAEAMVATFAPLPWFADMEPLVRELAHTARIKLETLRTDTDIFMVWTSFVVASERVGEVLPKFNYTPTEHEVLRSEHAQRLVQAGRDLMLSISRARVSMPKSTAEYIARCLAYREELKN